MDTNTHHEKHIKEAITKAGLEQPSSDFATHVMQKIAASDKIIAYKPLISKKGWLAIASTAIIFIVCSFYFKDDIGLPGWLNFEKLSGYITVDISETVTLSKNMVYGILLTSAVILLQIPFLKSWHSRTLWNNNY